MKIKMKSKLNSKQGSKFNPLKNYHINLNDFWSEDIERLYNGITNSQKESLNVFFANIMGDYFQEKKKKLNKEENFGEDVDLSKNSILYELVYKKARSMGFNFYLPGRLEVLLN